MRCTSLKVENFKQFEAADLTFSPGFTVVKGPNEAGKSSIQAAILAAFFLDPTSADEELNEYIRWGQHDRFRISLAFEDDSTSYVLRKDFQAGTLSLSWTAQDGGVDGASDDPAAVTAIIANLLGSTSLETYVNTACIREDEVSKAPATAAPVSQRLQTKVTGGRGASAADVLRTIESDLAAMTTGGPRRAHDTGVLRATRERIDSMLNTRSSVAARLAAHQENARLLQRIRDDLAGVDAEIATWTEHIELSDHAQTLDEECALLDDHLQELQRAEVLHDSIGRVAERLSGLDFGVVSELLDRARSLEEEIQGQKQHESEINKQMALALLSELQSGPAASATALLVGGIVLMIVGTALAASSRLALAAAAVVPGLVLVALGALRRAPARADRSLPFAGELRLCEERINAAQSELGRLLGSHGLQSVDEIAMVVRELRPVGELRIARLQRIARMLGEGRMETRQIEIGRVGQEIAARRVDLQVLASRRLSVEAYEHADAAVQRQRARRDHLLREMYRLEGELRANEAHSELLATIDEELHFEQIRLARLERRRKALERAQSGMKEALAATLAQASSVFRTGVTKHLASITGGKYDEVDARIDEDGLQLLVYTADRHRAVKADSLSRATQDQIYLAARMALLELVCDGRRPPLLLDDPFINYDDNRLANTMELLQSLYGEHQIVLFTCTDRYDRYADTVIALDAPSDLKQAQRPDHLAVS